MKIATQPKAEAPTDASILSRIMSEMGKKGGKIGGKRRLVTMTAQERSEVALKAAKARWSKRKSAHSKAV